MINVLVIGNSHVGAIKQGIDTLPSSSTIEFTYLALPGARFKGLKLSGKNIAFPESEQRFIQNTFGVCDHLAVNKYDTLLYVEGPSRLSFHLYSSNRSVPHLSSALIEGIVKSIQRPLFNLLQTIVEPSRLIFLGAPLVSSYASAVKYQKYAPLIKTPGEFDRSCLLASLIRNICAKTILDESAPSILLPPSHLLTANQFNTLDAYIRGGLRVDGRPRDSSDPNFEDDMGHGNSLYGQEMGRFLLDYFNKY
jgi:hypothetical protein